LFEGPPQRGKEEGKTESLGKQEKKKEKTAKSGRHEDPAVKKKKKGNPAGRKEGGGKNLSSLGSAEEKNETHVQKKGCKKHSLWGGSKKKRKRVRAPAVGGGTGKTLTWVPRAHGGRKDRESNHRKTKDLCGKRWFVWEKKEKEGGGPVLKLEKRDTHSPKSGKKKTRRKLSIKKMVSLPGPEKRVNGHKKKRTNKSTPPPERTGEGALRRSNVRKRKRQEKSLPGGEMKNHPNILIKRLWFKREEGAWAAGKKNGFSTLQRFQLPKASRVGKEGGGNKPQSKLTSQEKLGNGKA